MFADTAGTGNNSIDCSFGHTRRTHCWDTIALLGTGNRDRIRNLNNLGSYIHSRSSDPNTATHCYSSCHCNTPDLVPHN
jgi:hypothetical protein